LHALPSIFNRKSPVEIAENIGREYSSAFHRQTIFVDDAHRGDGKRFVVHADEKLTAFLELQAAIWSCGELPLLRQSWLKR
jgi:hypothetical protein